MALQNDQVTNALKGGKHGPIPTLRQSPQNNEMEKVKQQMLMSKLLKESSPQPLPIGQGPDTSDQDKSGQSFGLYDRLASLNSDHSPTTATDTSSPLGSVISSLKSAPSISQDPAQRWNVASNGNWKYGSTVVPMDAAKYAIGTFESGNDYNNTGPMTHLGRALGRYQVMEAELPGQLKQAGLPAMTSQEFLANKAAQDRLFETVFGDLMNKHGSFNDAASMWFSGRPVNQAGMRHDVFGTTVPKYLDNTNSLLAKYWNNTAQQPQVAATPQPDSMTIPQQ